MQRLQELHLQHNSVEVVSDQALAGLTSLALLDLSKNNLHTLGPASLQPLVSLQVLRITGERATPCSLTREHEQPPPGQSSSGCTRSPLEVVAVVQVVDCGRCSLVHVHVQPCLPVQNQTSSRSFFNA